MVGFAFSSIWLSFKFSKYNQIRKVNTRKNFLPFTFSWPSYQAYNFEPFLSHIQVFFFKDGIDWKGLIAKVKVKPT